LSNLASDCASTSFLPPGYFLAVPYKKGPTNRILVFMLTGYFTTFFHRKSWLRDNEMSIASLGLTSRTLRALE
jgi:hypothetical protein